MMSGHLGRPREFEVVHGLAGRRRLERFLGALLVYNDVLRLTERLVVLQEVEFLAIFW